MKKKKLLKVLSGVCVVTMSLGMLSGCGGNSTDSDGQTGKQETRKVSAMVQQSRNYKGLQKMVDKLEEEEGIVIDMQIVPDDQYVNLLQMKVNSGEAPDMIDYNFPYLFEILNPEEHLADLSGEEWTKELLNPDVVTYEDGKIYGFPFQASSGMTGMLYNKTVFEENNLEIPTTSAEFDEVCTVLKEKGISPLLLPSDTWVPQIWMSSGWAQALGSMEATKEFAEKIQSNQAKLTDYPELAEVIDNYLNMFKKGYFNEDYLTASSDDILERLVNGEGAMMMGSMGIMSTIKGTFPDAQIGMFNCPFDFDKNDLVVSGQFTIGFAASKDSKNLDTVKEIFDLWSTPEYADLWFEGNAGFPAFDGVNGGEVNPEVKAMYDEALESGNYSGETNNYLLLLDSLNPTKLWVYYLDAPAKGMTGMDILETYQKDIEQFLKEKQVEGF